ncbi:MAG: D-alanine--D-alanine ligase [Phycisphaerales bacterium]|nr:D-alanine--D-alanine ligase [Phycisphaerales bacterium]
MTRLVDKPAVLVPALKTVKRKLAITVLMGGPGSEREVSLNSGRRVTEALRALGHDVYSADIQPDDLSALERPMDMVFLALHGEFGEDGQVQQVLEQRGIKYSGSGPRASALAMDKVAAKCRFIEAHVPTPRFDVVSPQRVDKVLEHWTCPVVVKPSAQGSSVDCLIVRQPEELRGVLEDMTRRYDRCLLEEFIQGPELTVGILGEAALPPIQIQTRRDFYNYEAKYLDNDTEYRFDIDLPDAVLARIRDMSVQAHLALGCRDFSRVDWMVDSRTLEPYVLEINTIPGLTDHSLLPKAARQAGLSFEMLCQRIVELTCQR